MNHSKMMLPCLAVLGVAAALFLAFDAPLASLVPLLVCPLMMIVMMRTMSGMGRSPQERTGHGHEPVGEEQDPTGWQR